MASSQPTARAKTVALPAEHGSWSFLLEPILLGLLVAPTWAGVCFSVATAAAFLFRQPLKTIVTVHRRGRPSPRLPLARRLALIYGLVAIVGFILSLLLAQSVTFLLPLLLGLPFGLLALWYDLNQDSRSWQAELAAPIYLAATAACLALLAGWNLWPALFLWFILGARAIGAVVYVRYLIQAKKQKRAAAWPIPLFVNLLALLFIIALRLGGVVSSGTIAAFTLLLLRAIFFLMHPPVSVRTVGFTELALGLVTVVAIALDYW